ncbi:MAG: hypothetical protein IKU94_12600 [Bacteroidaceae bacterium]|nr:hypothetical protein [Bacteroidaceae bacterium]
MKKITSLVKSSFRTIVAAVALTFATGLTAQNVTLTALSGTPGYANEDFDALVDGKPETKWCVGSFEEAYIVFKASEAIVPTNYYLITGGDTGKFPDRNWKNWSIYAANFSSDADATRESSEWVLIDKKEKANDWLPAANTSPADFTFSENPTTAYTHFKIEVEEIAAIETSAMQMGEFSFGTSADSRIISYTPLATIEGHDLTAGEGASRLIDAVITTKWGSGTIPTWLIFKTSVGLKPTYYRLVTGNDNANNHGRNWKDWEIYGANFENDEDAAYDSEAWVLLDKKENIGTDVLPNENYKEVYLYPSETITEEYHYFKIVVNSINGAGFMQMGEFTWGDEFTFVKLRSESVKKYNAYNLNVVAQKALIEEYKTVLAELVTCEGLTKMFEIEAALNALQTEINNSANAYSTYASMVANVQKYLDEHPDMDAEGRALLESYISTNIEPNNTFMNGSYVYVMENGLLSAEEVLQEGAFITSLMEQYASGLTEGAIDVTYVVLEGTAGFSTNEDAGWMFDGTGSTKWCALGKTGYCVFKTSEAIQPTFYKLITGNDTGKNPSRNWKSWKLYAGNFESDEAATRDAEGWVVIDEKVNIGTDQLPAANIATAYFYLSAAPAVAYQYYRLEIEELMNNGDRFQMGDMSLFNQANFYTMRQEYTEQYEAFSLDVVAQQSLIDEYNKVLRELRSAANVATLGTASSRLDELQTQINTSVEKYAEYDAKVAELLEVIGDMSENLQAFFNQYLEANEAAGDMFVNGSYPFIMEQRPLSADQLTKEINYLNYHMDAMYRDGLIFLDGSAGYSGEGPECMFDGNTATKWCCPNTEGLYLIFKADQIVSPYFYTLVTGGDTQRFPERNWGTWRIYGANFEGDGAAKRDAEGWVLVDEKIDMDKSRLNPANNTASYFGMSTGLVEYQYYKVELESNYQGKNGVTQQMTEMTFGNREEFDEILNGYVDEADAFNLDVVAEQALLDQYDGVVEALDGAEEMEDLFAKHYAVVLLQNQITESANAYEAYKQKIEEIREFLASNNIAETEARIFLETYMNAEEAEEGVYPNGVFTTIYEEHVLPAETIIAETEYVETLRVNALREGYLPGADVTMLMQNPDFSKGVTGWEGKSYNSLQYSNSYGAEFYNEGTGLNAYGISQTITGLKNGIYEITITAGNRPSGLEGTSTNYSSMIYANGINNYVMSVYEGMVSVDEAVDSVNCHLTGDVVDIAITDELGDTIGYALHGIQSTCVAIEAGRHINKVLAVVEDGTLTFGIKDLGTGVAGDWTGFGNVKLTYAGSVEEATASMDNVLESQSARAKTLLAYNPDIVDYMKYPNFGNDLRAELTATIEAMATATDGASKKALIEKFSEIFVEIYEAKRTYLELVNTAEKYYEIWAANTAMTPEEKNEYLTYQEDIWVGFMDGLFSIEEAIAKIEDLKTKYPAYMYPKDEYGNNITITETAAFTYHVEGTGEESYFGLMGLFETLGNDEYVLAFEYKLDREVTDGVVYFGTPSLSSQHYNAFGTMDAASEWTPYYIDLRQARSEWKWGNGTDHWLRWDVTNGGAFSMDIRHIRVITYAEMEANGGSVGIEGIVAGESTATGVANGIFNLSGQRVSKPTKGLYIINGKKVLVK